MIEEIMKQMNKIKYGYIKNNQNIYPESDKDWDNEFSTYYRLQSPEDLLKTKYGVCWDQVELERYYLDEKNINSKTYFIVEYDGKEYPTHTFIVINDKIWFEHSWEKYRGIHEYNNLNELIDDIKNKFIAMLEKRNISTNEILIYEYKKPKYNITCQGFFHHCEQGKKILK